MPAAATAASAFVWTHARQALQHVAAIGACSTYRLASGRVFVATRSSTFSGYPVCPGSSESGLLGEQRPLVGENGELFAGALDDALQFHDEIFIDGVGACVERLDGLLTASDEDPQEGDLTAVREISDAAAIPASGRGESKVANPP